jgi:hypothetical protein
MGWAALGLAILKLLEPALDALLKKCMEEDMKDAAAELPDPSTFDSEGEAAETLFHEMIDRVPRWRRRKRKAYRRAMEAVVVDGALRATPLSDAEVREGCYLAGGATAEM